MNAARASCCAGFAIATSLITAPVNADAPSKTKAATNRIQYELKRFPKLDETLAPVYSWSARVEVIPGQLVGAAKTPADMLTLRQLSALSTPMPAPKWNEWAPEADLAMLARQTTVGVTLEALRDEAPRVLPTLHTVTESLPPAPTATPMPLRSAVLNAEASTYYGPKPQLVNFSQ